MKRLLIGDDNKKEVMGLRGISDVEPTGLGACWVRGGGVGVASQLAVARKG